MPYVYVGTDVLEEFDDDDLIFELKSRGLNASHDESDHAFEVNEAIRAIFEKRRMNEDYQKELDLLIWLTLGRIV